MAACGRTLARPIVLRRRGCIEESALALHAVQTLKGPSRVLGVPTDEHLLAAFDAYDKKVTEPARKALQAALAIV